MKALITGSIVLTLFSLLAAAQLIDAALNLAFRSRLMPGVVVGGVEVGGRTLVEARASIWPKVQLFEQSALLLHAERFFSRRLPAELGIQFTADSILQPAWQYGREASFLVALPRKIAGSGGKVAVPVGFDWREERFSRFIDEELVPLEREAKDASVKMAGQRVERTEAVVGRSIDRRLLKKQVRLAAGRLSTDPILLPLVEKQPEISDVEATQAEALLAGRFKGPLVLKAGFDSFKLSEELLWELVRTPKINGRLEVRLDRAGLREFLESLESQVNQAAQDAQLLIEGNRAIVFQPGKPLRRLKIGNSLERIEGGFQRREGEVELAIETKEPNVSLAELNDLGINELVARGESNFKGSPPNRRHNIGVGAKRFDGWIVQPGETFSFVKALGEVGARTGYRPELVIKGDQTVPEFGGGLCQVSTTAFRAILSGGYPVVERKNHSYRVVYYEPAGSDATIYNPRPDLKFTNDTPAAILIDTYLEGDYLFFDFYGTKLSRRVVLEGPIILSTTALPEPVYIKTGNLSPGVVKQVDIAHRGATTVLYRYVYEDAKLLRKDTFRSSYIPWPAKFLIGESEAPRLETDLKQAPTAQESSETPLTPLP